MSRLLKNPPPEDQWFYGQAAVLPDGSVYLRQKGDLFFAIFSAIMLAGEIWVIYVYGFRAFLHDFTLGKLLFDLLVVLSAYMAYTELSGRQVLVRKDDFIIKTGFVAIRRRRRPNAELLFSCEEEPRVGRYHCEVKIRNGKRKYNLIKLKSNYMRIDAKKQINEFRKFLADGNACIGCGKSSPSTAPQAPPRSARRTAESSPEKSHGFQAEIAVRPDGSVQLRQKREVFWAVVNAIVAVCIMIYLARKGAVATFRPVFHGFNFTWGALFFSALSLWLAVSICLMYMNLFDKEVIIRRDVYITKIGFIAIKRAMKPDAELLLSCFSQAGYYLRIRLRNGARKVSVVKLWIPCFSMYGAERELEAVHRYLTSGGACIPCRVEKI